MSTLLAFIATLGLLIVVHEYGHYRVAVACGVRVLRFSIGFGPVLWRYQRSAEHTEFVLCALPFGGYVQMLGHGSEPVAPTDHGRAFKFKPLWQRAAVVAAGPAANLVLAVALYAVVNWIGVQEAPARLATPVASSLADRAGVGAGEWVRAVSSDGQTWQEIRSWADLRWALNMAIFNGVALDLQLGPSAPEDRGATRVVHIDLESLPSKRINGDNLRALGLIGPYTEPVIGTVMPDGAAAQSGLRAGDRVRSVDGVEILEGAQLRQLIRAQRSGAPMRWEIERGTERLALQLTPRLEREGGQTIGRIGAEVGRAPDGVAIRYGIWDGLVQAAGRTWEMSLLTLRMMGRMLMLEESPKNITGPLTMADFAGQSARLGLIPFLSFLAVVSLSLGVLNLLPVPVLDGGHLMYYLFEAVTGRPLSDLWLERLQRGGIALVLALMSLALFNDLVRQLGHP